MSTLKAIKPYEQRLEQRLEDFRQGLARMVCSHKMKPQVICNGDLPNTVSKIVIELDPNLGSSMEFKTLEHNCLKLYEVQKDRVKDIFSKLSGQICLSVDSLVDKNQCGNCLCLSAQFVSSDWKLKKWIIKFFAVSHIKDSPTEAIMNALREYSIDSRILTMTVGSTSHLVDEVKENVQKQMKLPMNGQLFHVKCCCDLISQLVQKGFEQINKITGKVKFLRWSDSLPFLYHNDTKVEDSLRKFITASKIPSKKDRENVRSVCKIIDRIYEIIKGLFEMKRPSANLFLPHLQEIRAYLTAESTNSDSFVSFVAREMLEVFNKYWNDTYLVLSIAAFFDPRYKLKFVEFCLSDSEADTVLENICKIFDDGYAVCDQKEYLLSDSSVESEDADDEEEGEGSKTPSKKFRRKILVNLNILKEYCQSMKDQPQKSELDLYLEEPVLPWTEHFSVLNWWKDNCLKYPQLSRMARDFLAIPLLVATRFKAYCTEPREFDSELTSSKPELMNALMCTRSWKFDVKR